MHETTPPARVAVNPPGVFDSLPYGFSQAVASRGTTRVSVSGQVGIDADERPAGDDLETQTGKALENLGLVLQAAGGSLADVVALRIYLVAEVRDDLSPVSRGLRAAFPQDPPASTWVIVNGLARPEFLVEIEAEANLP